MNNKMEIQSHKGPYSVTLGTPFAGLEKGLTQNQHLIIDAKVAGLYKGILSQALNGSSVLPIEASEENKSLEKIPGYITSLSEQGVKRGDVLVAIGGGIIGDITAFIAAVLFRGVAWCFYPTTLLAQSDSCIGSKSSINVSGYKNQVGTFTPPERIHIATDVLETLSDADFCSGLGEIIKVHLIAGWEDFGWIEKNYDLLKRDRTILVKAIRRSLEIKKELIEKDEFDQKERLILNYGHSFGHAIESATHYKIPHGIAVTIGLDMANFLSREFGFITEDTYQRIRPLLRKNYTGFSKGEIPFDRFLTSIAKDKKNIERDVSLILSKGPGEVFNGRYPNDDRFQSLCRKFFREVLV